ncbi:MAG: LysM peptidoglycan-binding domain-containing protein [Candidatus Saelkia tenebricola]|nr:LysM peptidoglycan-binding domain-containing protein [Candidatus Saelkia tenebricola]
MKIKNRVYLVCLVLSVVFTGCIKTGTKEIIVPDQQIQGNQGYLQGCSPRTEKFREIKKKKIYDIEIEIPNVFGKEYVVLEDKDIWGNQGYMYKEEGRMKYMYVAPGTVKSKDKDMTKKILKESPVIIEDEFESFESRDVQSEETYMDYKVGKGESLWTIAKKVYGDATKWQLIYEHNKELLRDPKMIKPGMMLRLPLSSDDVREFIK